VPVKTVSEANMREHWRVKAKRVKEQKRITELAINALTSPRFAWQPPIEVKLTRVGVRKLDSDNLWGCAKAVRDQVAKWLGVDDGKEDLCSWTVTQTTGKPVGVRVEVYERGAR